MALLNELIAERSMHRLSVLYQNDTFGTHVASVLENSMYSLKLSPVRSMSVDASNFNEAVSFVCTNEKEGAPQAVFIIADQALSIDLVDQCKKKLEVPASNNVVFALGSYVHYDTLKEHATVKSWTQLDNIYYARVVPSLSDAESILVKQFNDAKANLNGIPTLYTLEGYLAGLFVAEALKRTQSPVTAQDFLDSIYEGAILYINGLRLGPFYYDAISNPFAVSEDKTGCNQGMRQVWIGALGKPSYSKSYTFYDTCHFTTPKTLAPVIFGHVGSDESVSRKVLQGISMAFNATNLRGGVNGRKLYVASALASDSSVEAAKNTLSTLLSASPNIAGLLGNQGEGATAKETLMSAYEKGVISFGALSGSSELRNPFLANLINVRGMTQDEAHKLTQYVIETKRMNKIAILHDGSPLALQTLNASKAQLFLHSMSAHSIVSTTENADAQSLYNVIFRGNDIPDIIICHGRMDALKGVLQIISTNSPTTKLAFTSMVTKQEIIDNTACETASDLCLLTHPMSLTNRYDKSLFRQFQQDASLFSKDPIAFDEFVVFEGYFIAQTLIQVIEALPTPVVSGKDISDRIMSLSIVNSKGVRLGPYSASNCTAVKVTQVTGCQCNQGMRSIHVYTFSGSASGQLEPVKDAETPFGELTFSECGIQLSQGKLPSCFD
jgi:ABC-type branched-subunit amino acid transport system substrate-binding protein